MRPPGALAGLIVVALAWPLGAPGSAAAPDPTQLIGLTFQPVEPSGITAWTARDMDALAADSSAWLASASRGRAGVSHVDVRPAIAVPDATCRELARAVATQRRHSGSTSTRTIYLGSASDCPYLGLAETPGTWVLIPNVGAHPGATSRTLVHELGHTLGLEHAGAETCPLLTAARAADLRCGVAEYGDRTDPLGRATLAWGLSALNLERLGWGDGLIEINGTGSHRVALSPVASPDADGLRVSDPVTGDVYVVSYRAPGGREGLDRELTADERGVYLHRLPRVDETEVGSVLLPWTSTLTRPHGGKAGYSYVAPGGGFALRVLSVSAAGSEVEVAVDPQGELVDTAGPVFSATVTITDLGAERRMRIPQAWDQSGVAGYTVRAGDSVIARLSAAPGLASQSMSLPRGLAAGAALTVRAIDGRGNVTVVRVR